MAKFTRLQLEDRAQLRIEDTAGVRWDKTEIQDYLNDGYQDFVRRTKCFQGQYTATLVAETSEYNLATLILASASKTLIEVTNMWWNGQSLFFPMDKDRESRIKTVYWMDKNIEEWMEETGPDVEYAILDYVTRHNVRIYPTPDDAISETDLLVQYAYEAARLSTDADPTTGTFQCEERWQLSFVDYAVAKALGAETIHKDVQASNFHMGMYERMVAEAIAELPSAVRRRHKLVKRGKFGI